MTEAKKNMNIVFCGHYHAGKSTLAGHLMYELGGISDKEMEKLKKEAAAAKKSSHAFAFYMDRKKEERERGITIDCTANEFKTDKYHYTVADAPGHRDFIKNFITGAGGADVGLLMVPADGNFTTSVQKGTGKTGEGEGVTRTHAALLNLLGVKQLVVGVNKMDTTTAGPYSEDRFNEIGKEMKNMLVRVGMNKAHVHNQTVFIPLSALEGDNLVKHSDKMPWYKGQDVQTAKGKKVKVVTLLDALNKWAEPPARKDDAKLRIAVDRLHNIKDVDGHVCTGHVIQGTLKPGCKLKNVGYRDMTAATAHEIQAFRKKLPAAKPGDYVGINLKGLLAKEAKKFHHGDILVQDDDTTLKPISKFTCQVQVINHQGELKPGFNPNAFVMTNRFPVTLEKINFKIGKETGGKKMTDPDHIKQGELGSCVFSCEGKDNTRPVVLDNFKNLESLGRVAIMQGNSVVMLGKIMKVEHETTPGSAGEKATKK